MVGFCFGINFIFLLELCWKNYAFGPRRAWIYAPLSIKAEYFLQILNVYYFILYLSHHNEN